MTKDYSHLIGETFGELTIFDISEPDTSHRSRRMAECLCSCGKSFTANLHSLLNGSIKTCGHTRELPKTHMSYEDFIGKRFGKLAISDIKYDSTAKRGHRVRAICKCDCGNEFETNFYTVKNGYKTSCGCEYEQVTRDNLRQKGIEVTNNDYHSTGIRNISKTHKGYLVNIRRRGKCIRKFAKTLEKAIEIKEEFLNIYEKQDELPQKKKRNVHDYVGQTFHHLTILSISEPDVSRGRMRFATCQCDCGNIKEIRLSRIIREETKSCGHLRQKYQDDNELIGQTFGELMILNVYRDKYSNRYTTCKCSCGKIAHIPLSRVIRQEQASCGHLSRKPRSYQRAVPNKCVTRQSHSTNVKNISKCKNGKYCISVTRNLIEKRKYVNTFEEALEVKQQFLKEFGEN